MAAIVGWDHIEARVVHVSSIVNGEYAENEMRKDFTPEERVAIAETVRAALPNRMGRNSRQNIGDLKGQRADDIAAARAGFGNAETLRQAKTTVDRGIPAVRDAMNSGEMSISAAAKVATMPKAEQRRLQEISSVDAVLAVGDTGLKARGDCSVGAASLLHANPRPPAVLPPVIADAYRLQVRTAPRHKWLAWLSAAAGLGADCGPG